MTILFHRAIKIGDNVVAIRAMYAIKCLFPNANLIVATNHIGANLYANLPFIDTLLNLEANPNAIYELKSIDYFIITHRIAANIAFAKSTNAKKIIIRAHLQSLLLPNFINDFNFFNRFRPESANLLRLTRLIDKREFKRNIKNINWGGGAKLRFWRENSAFVEDFLANMSDKMRFGDKSCKIIGVNIFGSGGVAHLGLNSWREIVEVLATEHSAYNFVILSAPTHNLPSFNAPNVAIFKNNNDLLNLVAMIARFSTLISVDTGSVHIADNLQIPTLGIYTRKMAKRWCGGTCGGRFAKIIMPNDKNETRDKEAILSFLRANLIDFSENSANLGANPVNVSANPANPANLGANLTDSNANPVNSTTNPAKFSANPTQTRSAK